MKDYSREDDVKENRPTEADDVPQGWRDSQKGVSDGQDTPINNIEIDRLRDDKDRLIAIRSEQNGDSVHIRAYDEGKCEVPDRLDYGQAGRCEMHLQRDSNGEVKSAHLSDIEVFPEYQKAGIASEMSDKAIEIARENGAKEINGVIENQDAQNFWKNMEKNGWKIDYSQGYYGTVYHQIGS